MLTRPVRALCILALATACAGGDAEPARPNVLLISIDTLRADHLGCYGYERATSPRMDALAKEGALFEEAFSPSSWTPPAHMTLLTGLPVSIAEDPLSCVAVGTGRAMEDPVFRGVLMTA